MTDEHQRNDEPIGLMHSWWRGDPLTQLAPISGLAIEQTDDIALLATVTGLTEGAIQARFDTSNQVWIARLDDDLVGYGWDATRAATIEPLGLTLNLGQGERYIWDFVTLPEWRGRGIYPRIIQQMVELDPDATRIWIGHDLPNIASRKGIAKTGVQFSGLLLRSATTGYCFIPDGAARDRAAAAAALLGVRFAPDEVRGK